MTLGFSFGLTTMARNFTLLPDLVNKKKKLVPFAGGRSGGQVASKVVSRPKVSGFHSRPLLQILRFFKYNSFFLIIFSEVKIQIEFQSSAICHITNDYIDDNSATIYNDVLRSRLQSRQMNNIKAG